MADSPAGAIRQRPRTKRLARSAGWLLGLCLLPALAGSQKSPGSGLVLKILPEKTEYSAGEKVWSRVSFAKQSDQRVCFPPPQLDCTNTRSGSVLLKAVPPAGAPDSDNFICHIDGQGWGRELLPEIRGKWIQVPPGAAYATDLAEAQANVEKPGVWRLVAYYRPPVAHFSDRARYRRYLQTAAAEAGCAIPDALASAPIEITVWAKPEKK
jgi:hypothetical protein